MIRPVMARLCLTHVLRAINAPFCAHWTCWTHQSNKAVLEPRVSPDFAITYFCNHCNIRFENTDQSMWIHWPFFPKTWTKGHWPLDDLWPHVCWGHMCDSTQGSLCPSPMTIHQCMWIQWSILENTTYIHTYTYIHILHTEWVITYSLTEISSGETKTINCIYNKIPWFFRNLLTNQ